MVSVYLDKLYDFVSLNRNRRLSSNSFDTQIIYDNAFISYEFKS
jgi:hypothetical protein